MNCERRRWNMNCGKSEKFVPSRNDDASSLRYSANLPHRRMSERSSQRRMSPVSSVSVRFTAMRAIATAAASWSKDAARDARFEGSVFHTPAHVVTRMRARPDECW